MSEEELKQKYWVFKRCKCTAEKTLKELSDVISYDIEEFNHYGGGRKKFKSQLSLEKDKIEVYQTFYDRGLGIDSKLKDTPTITIRKSSDDTFAVFLCDEKQFEIERKWDLETLECQLSKDGNIYNFYQISQLCIGKLLFE
ncbi:MAG: hypothetical protein F4170_07840 [Rhodobacteraceae bacterium]|nr:hypothetical protein [Paracoccaceae bacterium]